ncbi:hypothetical protein GH141_00990 [bacterium]|nr:hypothetical protein [bacterium]
MFSIKGTSLCRWGVHKRLSLSWPQIERYAVFTFRNVKPSGERRSF